MKHQMQLKEEPYNKIRSGIKTIELRLFDEKRSKIKKGDIISFQKIDSNEFVEAEVKALHRFDSFEQLYSKLPLEKCGYTKDSISEASHLDMRKYYSEKDELKYGVIGIEIELIVTTYENAYET